MYKEFLDEDDNQMTVFNEDGRVIIEVNGARFTSPYPDDNRSIANMIRPTDERDRHRLMFLESELSMIRALFVNPDGLPIIADSGYRTNPPHMMGLIDPDGSRLSVETDEDGKRLIIYVNDMGFTIINDAVARIICGKISQSLMEEVRKATFAISNLKDSVSLLRSELADAESIIDSQRKTIRELAAELSALRSEMCQRPANPDQKSGVASDVFHCYMRSGGCVVSDVAPDGDLSELLLVMRKVTLDDGTEFEKVHWRSDH